MTLIQEDEICWRGASLTVAPRKWLDKYGYPAALRATHGREEKRREERD